MSFCIDDEKLLEKYKAIKIDIEHLKNIKLMLCQSMMTNV